MWHSLAAVLFPFVVQSAYLAYTRAFDTANPTSDFVALAGSVLVAVACLATMPLRPDIRLLLVLVFAPLLCILLFFYSFAFLGVVFDNTL